MKHTLRRALAFLLAAVVLLACGSAVFALNEQAAPFSFYYVLGDSVPIKEGPGLGPDVRTDPSLFRAGTYPDIIKKALGNPDSYCCAHGGWRIEEALYAIGGEDLSSEWVLAEYGGEAKAKLAARIDDNIAALSKADLITVNLGNNNLLATLAYTLNAAFEKENAAFSGSKLDRAVLDALNRAKSAVSDYELLTVLLNALETMDRGKVLLQNALKDLPAAMRSFPSVWNKLIARIREVNPDAKIVVVGMYNPIGNVVNTKLNEMISLGSLGRSLSKGLCDMIGLSLSPLIEYFDNYMRCGSPYAKDYVYVDISGVDLSASLDGVHLGAPGHQFFSQQILSAVRQNFTCTHEHTLLKNVRKASLLVPGYSGDSYCADCGILLGRGSITTFWHK